MEKNSEAEQYANGSLKILIQKGSLNADFIENFQSKTKIKLDITEVSNEAAHLDQIIRYFDEYDILQISSFHLSALENQDILQDVSKSYNDWQNLVSPDFSNLIKMDLKRKLLPFSWGVNGLIFIKGSFPSPPVSFDQIHASGVRLLPSLVEIYMTIERTGKNLSTWIKDENSQLLKLAVESLSTKNYSSLDNPINLLKTEKISLAQVSNGQAAVIMKSNPQVDFYLPEPKSTLWLTYFAISKSSSKQVQIEKFLKFISNKEHLEKLFLDTGQASVFQYEKSSLPELMQANHIRNFPLDRLDFVTSHMAFQPLWQKILMTDLPEYFDEFVPISGESNSAAENSK